MAGGVVTPRAIPITAPTEHPLRPAIMPVAGERWEVVGRWLAWSAFAVILTLAALAPIARTGDAHQYYAMATALADLRPPALTPAEAERFKAWLQAQPDGSGFASSARAIDQPPLIVDGRQEFSHFWLYPLLAAPAVSLMTLVNAHPGYAFLIVNAALLGLALWHVQRAYGAAVSLLVLASPLIWFVNKAQVEVFTVSLLAIAIAQAGRGRWLWAGLAAAVASTQNAPILAAVACFWGAGLIRQLRVRERPRITRPGLALVVLTLVIGALHPAYYMWRLGVPTPQRLNGGIDLRPPSPERYLAVLLDPDIGLLPWLPLTGLVGLLGLWLLWRPASMPSRSQRQSRPSVGELLAAPVAHQGHNLVGDRGCRTSFDGSSKQLPYDDGTDAAAGWADPFSRQQYPSLDRRLAALCGLVIGAWFLFVFAQTTNVNSGGTVHISRYALWLLPLALPLLASAADWMRPRVPALLPAAGGLAMLAYATAFQPTQPEQYVTQSPQAAFVTTWLPELYRTVPEIFYERQVHSDGGVRGSAATAKCHIILLHAEARELPCTLSASEDASAAALIANGWEAVWITRPGPFGFGAGGVSGAVPRP